MVITTTYNKRETVFLEGDPCHGFYVVKSGRVKLVRTSRDGKEQIIKILQPGEILGMEVFYDGKRYANTSVAMEDSELCFIEKGAFYRILGEYPIISRKIIVALSKELSEAYEKIGHMGLKTAREKMAYLLYTLAKDYGVMTDGKIRLTLNLSRLEIAEILGITQETSIRLLKAFKEEGILDIKRKEIIIKSMERLKEVGE